MGALRYNFDLIFANLLFGANFSFYVSLTRNYLDFQQIFMLQVLAASIFFIPFALFSKQSYRIPLRDFGNILIVTVLIVYGWMFMLLWGASYTSPIDASTISTLGPVFTILTGHFLLRERTLRGHAVSVWCWVSQVRLSSCSTRGFGWHPAAAAWATPWCSSPWWRSRSIRSSSSRSCSGTGRWW